MRTSTKLLIALALALTVSAPAGAVISIGLTQVGGTCVSTGPDQCFGGPGDTLVLSITWSVGSSDTLSLIDPAIVWGFEVQQFIGDKYASPYPPNGSTETYTATFNPPPVNPALRKMSPIAFYDIGINPLYSNMGNGWEKAAPPGNYVTGSCASGACTSMGTASFIISGFAGTIVIGGVGMAGGTAVTDSTFLDIAGTPGVSLGHFYVNIPEPTTACLLGLGLVALTAASRRRKD